MHFNITRLLRSALPGALLLLLTACGGGGSGSSGTVITQADVIGTWKLMTVNSVDVSSAQISMVASASTYTLVAPAFGGQPSCSDFGTWSLSGNQLATTPIAGSSCGNAPATHAISISGSTMTFVTANETQVYQKQTASSVTGNALVGTWKIMAVVNAGTVTPMNNVSSTVILNPTTYSISLPNCSETGTWSVSGSTLSFVTDAASTCGSSATYTEKAYFNSPLLTQNLSGTAQDIIWQRQATGTSSAPASTTVASASGGVRINWQLVGGATSYNIYRGTASGALATKTVVGSVTSGTYLDATVVAGTTYYYQITSVDSNGESVPSAEVSGTAAPVPSPVTGLAVTPGDAQAALSWNAVSGATSYNIYYTHTSAGGIVPAHAKSLSTTPSSYLTSDGWTQIPGTNITSAAATVTGLINGDTYQFMVTAVNANGESLSTSYVETVPVAANPVPAPVTGLTATPGAAQAALSWTAASGATSYNVYYNHYASGSVVVPPMKTANLAGPDYYALSSWTKVPGTNITSPGVTITGLISGDTYQFIVTPVNATGEGLATSYVEVVAQ